MRLYHYTNEHAFMQIRKSGVLRCSGATGVRPAWVSLTTDNRRWGHGLPDGRPISIEEAESIAHHTEDGRHYSFDHTACRLVFDLAEDDELIAASDHHELPELIALGVTGWCPTWGKLPTSLMLHTAILLQHGILENKAPTWWYYKKDLPVSRAIAFEVRIREEEYRAMP